MGCCSTKSEKDAQALLWLNSEFEFWGGWQWTEDHDKALREQFNGHCQYSENCEPFIAIIISHFSLEGDYKAYVHASLSPLSQNYQDIPSLLPRYQITVMGAHGVGKTSLVERICFGTFGEVFPTAPEETFDQKIDLNVNEDIFDDFKPIYSHQHRTVQHVIADFFDFNADEELLHEYRGLEELTTTIIGESDIIMLVFSVTDDQSFGFVKDLRDRIIRTQGSKNPLVMVLCNKWDLKVNNGGFKGVSVDLNQVYEYVKAYGVPYVEISAKTGQNAYVAVRQAIYEHYRIKVFGGEAFT